MREVPEWVAVRWVVPAWGVPEWVVPAWGVPEWTVLGRVVVPWVGMRGAGPAEGRFGCCSPTTSI